MRRITRVPLLCGLILLLASPALAQEAAEDDLTAELARIGLEAPPSLRKAKRREARDDGWAVTLIGVAAVGYDSNIHKGDHTTRDSAVFDLGAKVDSLFYFTRRDRLKFSIESTNSPYTNDSSKVSDYTQQANLFYGHRSRRFGSTTFTGEAKHQNDSATNADGSSFTRDFEAMVYRGTLAHRVKLADRHNLKLSYSFKRKDYFETAGLDSLDWWRHGPKLQYSLDCGDRIRWKSSYQFQHQLYDEEVAADDSGDETGVSTEEKHFFHTARTGLEWQITSQLVLDAGFRFRHKDDRFDDFESYYDYQGDVELTFAPTPSLRIELGQKISHRDYTNRPENVTGATATGTLKYLRYRTHFLTRYEISDRLAVWTLYNYDKRDANRVGGTSYRDFDQHKLIAGVTAAF